MRSYVVQRGDSPAKIAIAYAGCPKCTADLVAANPQKRSVRYPNGFVTFDSLRVGEQLALPDKWFDGTLDRLPKGYFDRLPAVPVGVGRPPVGRAPKSPMGLGATVGGTLSHCDAFSMNVTLSNPSGDPMGYFDPAAYDVTASPQQPDGSYNVKGVYIGPASWSWADGTDWSPVAGGSDTMTINSFAVTGKSTAGGCAPGLPPCPSGQVHDSVTGACVPACPSGGIPVNGVCLTLHLPPGGGNPGGGFPGMFTYKQGHRIQSVGTPVGVVTLPASIASETMASVQAQFDASAPGQWKVVSVAFGANKAIKGATSVTVVADYCGPTQAIAEPSTATTTEGVAMQFTHTDLGASPAGACGTVTVTPPASTSSGSAGTIGAVVAALGIGGLIWWTMK